MDVEGLVRFMMWSTSAGGAVVIGHWIFNHEKINPEAAREALKGLFAHALFLAIHQFYWHVSYDNLPVGSPDHLAVMEYRWVSVVCEVGMIFSTVWVMAPFLMDRFGRFWMLGGVGFLMGLAGFGAVVN